MAGAAADDFELEPGLELTLVATEPDVIDPIAMAFDEAGKMYVVEGRGYPVTEGAGRIALLTDGDGDGRYTRESEFAEGLRFPTGLMPWKGGLIVTDAPDVLYLKDTDGDGKSDHREVLLTGFQTDKSTQLRVNDPTLAPDGWIYFAGGLSGGKITATGADAAPVNAGDVRWNPATNAIEALDGRSQYGIAFDTAWRRFLCTNRIQNKHVVLPSRLLQRNPKLRFSESVQVTPVDRIDDLLKSDNRAARLFPISANVTTADSHAGTFSAACAVTVYRGRALPERYHGASFACDPTANLVHVDRLVPNGVTFEARRFPGETEFLRGRDDAFRPVFLAEGPGGGLFICDMRRTTIEHPDYLPEEVRKRTDFVGGKDEGRIYRVGGKVVESSDLSGGIDSADAWVRDTAMRLAIESGEGGDGASGGSEAGKVLRVEMGGMPVAAALADASPLVREAALRKIADSGTVEDFGDTVLGLADDPDPRVRFRAALALGDWGSGAAASGLAKIGLQDGSDRWVRAAVLSGAAGRFDEIWEVVLAAGERAPVGFVGELATLRETGEDHFVSEVLASALVPAAKVAALAGVTIPEAVLDPVALAMLDGSDADWAIAFLGRRGDTAGADVLAFIAGRTGDPAALRAVAALPFGRLQELVGMALPPALLQAAVTRLARNQDGCAFLFGALEDGNLATSIVGPGVRTALAAADPERAAKLLAAAGGSRRMEVFESLKPLAARMGDPALGRVVFGRACASCHRLDGEGHSVGPDLYGVRNQSKEAILLHIVVPNRELLAGFETCLVRKHDGTQLVGILGSETATSVTVRMPLGIEQTVLRSEVDTIEALPVSLMPDGLEAGLDAEEVAGLLAFLRGE